MLFVNNQENQAAELLQTRRFMDSSISFYVATLKALSQVIFNVLRGR